MKKLSFFVLVVGLCSLTFGAPTLYSGTRTWSEGFDSELIAFGSWASYETKISWNISQRDYLGSNFWFYEYKLEVPQNSQGGGISHFILGVSRDLTFDELKSISFEQGTYNSEGPRFYGALYGVKFGLDYYPNVSDRIMSLSFYTRRSPMWGDFYAKGGLKNKVFNDSLCGPIGVPDTNIIPSPGSVILGGLGTLLVGLLRRRF